MFDQNLLNSLGLPEDTPEEEIVAEDTEEVENTEEVEETPEAPKEAPAGPDYSAITKSLSERLGVEVTSVDDIPGIVEGYKAKIHEYEAQIKGKKQLTPLFEKLTNYVENSSDPDKALLDFVAINTTDYDKILKENPLEIIIQGMKANKKYSALSEEAIRKQVDKKFGLDRIPLDDMDEDERKDVLSDMQFAAIEDGHLDLLKSHQAEMQKPDLQKQKEAQEAAMQKVWQKYEADAANELLLVEKEGIKVGDYTHKVVLKDKNGVNKGVAKTIESVKNPIGFISRFYNFQTGEINAKEIVRLSLLEEQMDNIAKGIKTISKTDAITELHKEIENPHGKIKGSSSKVIESDIDKAAKAYIKQYS